MAGQSISKGALVLTTDAAQLQSGLSKAQAQIASFSNRVTGLLGAQLGFSALSGFADQIKAIGDESENLLNLSEVFEVNVEKMQALAMAANLAGIETETLVKAMRVAAVKFPGGDNIESLFKAMEHLRSIPNVQERIKEAQEIFGGRSAVEVLKIMKADLPEVARELEKNNVLTKEQHEAWDAFGDAVVMAFNKIKNMVKGGVANVILGMAPPERAKGLEELTNDLISLRRQVDEAKLDVIASGFSNNAIDRAYELGKAYDKLANEVVRLQNAATDLESSRIAKIMQDSADAAERFKRSIQDENISKMANAAKEFLDFSTPVDKANLAIAHMQGLLEAGLLTAEEFQIAAAKIADTFKDVNQEFKLPTAAFRGSVEDISARIQSSRSGEQKEMLNIWQRLERNGIKLQGIDGVQN